VWEVDECSADTMKESWLIKSVFIEDSAYFCLFIRHISTTDPFSIIKLFDVLSTAPFSEYYPVH